jgi:glutamate---cysteine ligase / carboxylate-amine ligase
VSFGSEPPLSVGIEEELFFVDRETLDTAPLFESVVSEPGPRLKPEVFECIVEIATPVCADAAGALWELAALRAEVARRAKSHGATVLAAGTHPFARGEGQPIVPLPRYQRMRKELGDRIYTQLVCGLHVHVSMPDAATCLRAFEGVVPWLPVLLALSANSPFVEGRDSGFRSVRADRLLLMPTGGTPPLLPDWPAWEDATQGDDGRRHWDAWPRPEHGTLEVRVTDQQTDVRRAAGFAAIVQALVATVVGQEHTPCDRTLYARRRDDAARRPPDPDEVAALGELVEPAARKLGASELAKVVLDGRPEAERQLELGPEAAVPDIARRSLSSVSHLASIP